MGEQCSMSSTRASQGSTRLSHRDALLLRKLADSRTASRSACRRQGGCLAAHQHHDRAFTHAKKRSHTSTCLQPKRVQRSGCCNIPTL